MKIHIENALGLYTDACNAYVGAVDYLNSMNYSTHKYERGVEDIIAKVFGAAMISSAIATLVSSQIAINAGITGLTGLSSLDDITEKDHEHFESAIASIDMPNEFLTGEKAINPNEWDAKHEAKAVIEGLSALLNAEKQEIPWFVRYGIVVDEGEDGQIDDIIADWLQGLEIDLRDFYGEDGE